MNERRMWYTLSALRDTADSRHLWEEIFPEDSKEFLDYYDAWKRKDNLVETRRRGGELISMIHWNPYRIHRQGRTEETCYVVAVATRPEYRHRGLMAGQLRDGMKRFYREGMPFLFLMPADPAIYEPFDFRYIYSRKVEDVRSWGQSDETCGLTVRPLAPEEWEAAARFMESRLAETFGCYTERTAKILMRMDAECRSEGGELVGIFEGPVLAGCFAWWGEEKVEIREMILSRKLSAPEMRPVLGGIISRYFPEAEEITSLMAEPAGADGEPIIMARLVNLASFLAPVTSEEVRETVIRVEDKYIPENNGCFRWTMGPEGSTVERVDAEEPEITIGAADLTRRILEDARCFFPEIV